MNFRALWGCFLWAALAGVLSAEAQPLTTIYSFINGPATPLAGMTFGNDGNLYGTTASGGLNNEGTAFKMTTNGNITTLANFGATYGDPTYPEANLTLGPDGNFYGTSSQGGTNLSGFNATGTVFKMTTNGTMTTLVDFNGVNGGIPLAGLALGADGNFYGTTEFGGANGDGTVFKMTTNGTLTSLVSFNGTNGMNPFAGLAAGPGGNLYGTTRFGGTNGNFGTVFAVTTNGAFFTVFNFAGTNGAAPYGPVTVGPDGNLYGTTSDGSYPNGADDGGTAFELTTNGVLTTLVTMSGFFGSIEGTSNGVSPRAGLTLGPDGNFYGTTFAGGTNGSGTVFQVTTNAVLAALTRAGISYQTYYNFFGVEFYSTNGGSTIAEVFNGTLTTLYSFSAQTNSINADGAQPQASVSFGTDGDIYGTAAAGGTSGYGTAFKLTTNGTFTTLTSFSGNHGDFPMDALTPGPDGSLYGTANSGGTLDYGTVFKLDTNDALTTLVNFDRANDGANPQAGLIVGPDGNFYGTAAGGGTNLLQTGPSTYDAESFGTVFELTTNGVFTTLAYFNGANGANPYGGLTVGTDGNFYGTTTYGGISNDGTVFQMKTNGTLTTLTNFTGLNGANPFASLIEGLDGNFYGTTEAGGTSNQGTVFQVTTSGALKTLVNFTGTNGVNPNDGLLLGTDGNFYGTAWSGGSDNGGTVFKVTTGGTLTTLVNFAVTNGEFPVGGLALGPDGNYYGTTELGGVLPSSGTVFKVSTSGVLTTLFDFTFSSTSPNGNYPFANLTLATNGNFIHFYGTTYNGPNGPSGGGGTIFRVNPTTAYTVTENSTNTFSPLTNDVLWTIGGTLSLTGATATNGTGQINGSGIIFKPAANFIGTAGINYATMNSAGGTNLSFITVLVTNIPPVANPDFYSVAENSSANVFNPLTNDTVQTSGGTLSLVRVSATNGTAVISGTNVLFTPTANFTGTATIGYTITDNVGGTNTSLITVTVINTSADLSLSASAAPEPVGVNSNLAYAIAITNQGPGVATGVVVSNQLPAGVTFVSATGGATPVSGMLLLNLGTLTNNTVTNVQVIVQPTAAGNLTNLFQVFASTADPVLTNNSATVVSTVTNAAAPSADLSLSGVTGTGGVDVGTALAYYLAVTNLGPSAATGIVISNRIPAYETFYSTSAGAATTNNNVLLVSLGSLAAGTGTNVTITVYPMLPAGLASGELTNMFTVSASQTDPVLTNNSITLVNGVDLAFPGTPLTGVSDPGGTVIVSSAYVSGIGPVQDGIPGDGNATTVSPGDLILLLDASGGNNPTNWAAVVRFFNPADPTGTNGLTATYSEAFFATNFGGAGFTGFNLLPNTDYISTTYNTTNGVTTFDTGYNEFGPAGFIAGGQEDVFILTVTTANADLSLSASAAPEPVTVGNPVTYSLMVSNGGALTATDVVISNQIPAGVSFLGASGGATPVNGILLMNLGSLAAGTNVTVLISEDTTVTGRLTNVFQVSSDLVDPVLSNNTATVVSTVTNVPANFGIPGTPFSWNNPGGSFVIVGYSDESGAVASIATRFATVYTNFTTAAPGDVVLLLDPSGGDSPTNWGAVMEFFNPGDPTGSNGLPATDFESFLASNTTSNGFANFPLLTNVLYIAGNATTLAGAIAGGDSATATEFGPAGDILAGQEASIVFIINTRTTCTITSPVASQVVSNAAFMVTGITTTAALAVTNVYVQVNGSGWTNATTANGWTNWSAAVTLTPGSNTVQAYAMDTSFGTASPTNSVTFDYVVVIPASADLKLSASAAPEPVGVNSNLVYSIIITNQGPNTATGVVVSNQLPTGVTFVSATGGATPTSGILLLNLGSLTNNTVTNVQITVQPTAAGKLTNLFVVFSSVTDPVPTNNSATVISTVTNALTPTADLSLSASAAPQLVGVGSNLVYYITVTNQGPDTASNVTLDDVIPAGVNFVSATGGSNPFMGVLLLYLGTLTNGATTNVQVIVQPTVAGQLTNGFTVVITNDPVLTNNSATVISTVTNGPPSTVDVAVSITSAPNPVAVGAPLTYSVTVTNNSITTATGVVVSNTLPPDVTLFSLLPSQGSATNQSSIVIYSVGSLANGIAATLAIVVIPNATNTLTNSDYVVSAQTDSQPANNRATNLTTVVSVPITNLALTVQSPMTLDPQTGLYEQQIEVANGGPSTPASVLVEVSGLAANATLYNATGKTNGLPYVQSASPLPIGSNVVFLLEFYVPTRVAPTNLTYTVIAGPVVIPPVANGTIISVRKTVMLADGDVLVEFNAIPGQVYAVQYTSDIVTWLTAIPAITAGANEVQWIDSGPPQTISSPAQVSARYYRVVLLTKH